MDFNAQLITADTAVKIGESNQSTNKVGINVTGPAETEVKVTIIVGCGANKADLLDSQNALVKVTGLWAGKTTNMDAVANPPTGRQWDTGDFPIVLPVSISLKDFVSNTPEGDAEITVLVEKSQGPNEWEKGESFPIKVNKKLESRLKPEIRYFTVNPNYILHAGQTKVTVTFCATGYETLTLFRNNEEVQNWADPGAKSPSIFGEFLDKPSITSVYRLEGKYKTQAKTEVPDSLDRTVQVISPGWNQIALPQGSPIRLFVAKDFSSGSDRLYGIFKQGRAYALYSSATGIDAWRLEPGNVPEEMAKSPGVYYNNKLWLIGGSSDNPDIISNQVHCYEAVKGKASRSWQRKVETPKNSAMPARMGHACVVFNEKILVIGGYNGAAAFNDVWTLTESNDGIIWAKLVDKCGWAPRLNPAATCKRVKDKRGKDQDQVWIYGGSTSTQGDPLANEFWSTTDGINWQDMTKGQAENDNRPVPIMPDPGAPLASALVAFGDRLILMGSFQEWNDKRDSNVPLGNRIFSFLFEWHPGTALWEARPVFDGWQQFAGQNFYMQAVVYNRFLFCWSLPNDKNFTGGRLNILVSH